MAEVFTSSTYYRCPPFTDHLLRSAEARLGYRLPSSYVDVLREQNGGTLVRGCYPTSFATSWAPDHVELTALLGIGGERGIDAEFGSAYLIEEWSYPSIGVVLAATPSGGHDTVMLDYSSCPPSDEPTVVFVDEDRVPRLLAPTFAEFFGGLHDCASFAQSPS